MGREELMRALEQWFALAEQAPTPSPGSSNAIASEWHQFSGALAAVEMTGALTEEEVAEWRARAEPLKRRMGQEFLAAREVARREDHDSRLRGRMVVEAERILRSALWTVSSWRDLRARGGDAEGAALRAEGAAHAMLHLGLITFEDYVIWGQMFQGADADDPARELLDEVSVDVGPLESQGSTLTVDLDLNTDAWQITALDLLADCVRICLVQHEEPPRHLQPRVALSDDTGTEYAPSRSTSSGRPTAMTWRVRFKPAPPREAQALLLTVDQYRFRISYNR